MPRFTAEQIYAFARQAGFSPDQATTMTAVAMAESGGDSRSHATIGEDSRGLWQINAAAHPDLAQQFNLYDPAQNAKAAFIASHGGADVSPWTTTHGGLAARYLRFRDDAQAAAAAYGDGPNHGVWTGTAGYGHPLSAGGADARGATPVSTDAHTEDGSAAVVAGHTAADSTGGDRSYGIPLDQPAGRDYGIPLDPDPAAATHAAADPAAADPGVGATAAASGAGNDHLHTFLSAATAQNHDEYIFGVMDRLDDPNPKAFDCSMLVQWSAHQAGADLPRNAWDQYKFLHDKGMVIPVDQAIHTPGAVLFSFNSDPNGTAPPVHQHVAISLGDGKTIEALGRQYGVGSWDATPQRFQYAAVIPGISDHAGQAGHAGAVPMGDAQGDLAATSADASHPSPTPTVSVVGDPQSTDPHAPTPHVSEVGATDDFNNRLAVDPDHLDSSHPNVSLASAADPHSLDPHAVDANDGHDAAFFSVDANDDGLNDSLQEVDHISGPEVSHDDAWDHDDHHAGHP